MVLQRFAKLAGLARFVQITVQGLKQVQKFGVQRWAPRMAKLPIVSQPDLPARLDWQLFCFVPRRTGEHL